MIDLLAEYGASRSVEIMAYYGDVRTAAAVFAANPALADDTEALANAAGEGQDAFVRLMLVHQSDLARRASFGAKTRELTEFLFEHGMDPSRPDWLGITPLHHIAMRGDLEKATVFIEHGADLDARDEELRSTPLGYAAKCGSVSMVELLLNRGARPNLPDDPPWATPLAWASRRGHTGVAEILRQAGAKA
jgi:ankyrin repeat protein